MMNKFAVISIILGVCLLVGCNSSTIPTEQLSLDYLDEEALTKPDQELTYSEINGVYVHDFIKENKDKAVRWTATVVRIEDDKTYELQEPLLPTILLTFIEGPSEPIKVGDTITFSGILIGYGETFGKDPLWVVRPGHLEETTAEEKAAVETYRKAVKTAKKEVNSN
ncbi:hypothetical protein [Sutcliffiella halmapala]|uniref:hypothetical protein n=1 Tax=Sutcliffiella halmapala TaxID=79882 RepID=UPI00111655FD|nr:hypothetical protein [Sutcliffiella halmapala]